MGHEQVSVKVNTRCDRGIAPLVEALSRFPEVMTVESCEGCDDQPARVAFLVGDGDDELIPFVRRLSVELRRVGVAEECGVNLSAEWYAGGEGSIGYLRTPRQQVRRVAEAITRLTGGDPLPPEPPRYVGGTIAERVTRYLRDTGNRPATIAQIYKAIGSTRGGVAMVIYRTHKTLFESAGRESGGHRCQLWRLVEPQVIA